MLELVTVGRSVAIGAGLFVFADGSWPRAADSTMRPKANNPAKTRMNMEQPDRPE
jgi:hypothetical protein